MNEIERLRQAIRDLHGCDSAHVQSVAVQETFQGNVVWEEMLKSFG
jgi:hypothetical protein